MNEERQGESPLLDALTTIAGDLAEAATQRIRGARGLPAAEQARELVEGLRALQGPQQLVGIFGRALRDAKALGLDHPYLHFDDEFSPRVVEVDGGNAVARALTAGEPTTKQTITVSPDRRDGVETSRGRLTVPRPRYTPRLSPEELLLRRNAVEMALFERHETVHSLRYLTISGIAVELFRDQVEGEEDADSSKRALSYFKGKVVGWKKRFMTRIRESAQWSEEQKAAASPAFRWLMADPFYGRQTPETLIRIGERVVIDFVLEGLMTAEEAQELAQALAKPSTPLPPANPPPPELGENRERSSNSRNDITKRTLELVVAIFDADAKQFEPVSARLRRVFNDQYKGLNGEKEQGRFIAAQQNAFIRARRTLGPVLKAALADPESAGNRIKAAIARIRSIPFFKGVPDDILVEVASGTLEPYQVAEAMAKRLAGPTPPVPPSPSTGGPRPDGQTSQPRVDTQTRRGRPPIEAGTSAHRRNLVEGTKVDLTDRMEELLPVIFDPNASPRPWSERIKIVLADRLNALPTEQERQKFLHSMANTLYMYLKELGLIFAQALDNPQRATDRVNSAIARIKKIPLFRGLSDEMLVKIASGELAPYQLPKPDGGGGTDESGSGALPPAPPRNPSPAGIPSVRAAAPSGAPEGGSPTGVGFKPLEPSGSGAGGNGTETGARAESTTISFVIPGTTMEVTRKISREGAILSLSELVYLVDTMSDWYEKNKEAFERRLSSDELRTLQRLVSEYEYIMGSFEEPDKLPLNVKVGCFLLQPEFAAMANADLADNVVALSIFAKLIKKETFLRNLGRELASQAV